MADITINLLRFDPSMDDAPYYKEYVVPWIECESGIVTGLQALKYINENIESIAFDSCCYSGTCGRCSCMIDGVPSLSCVTPLTPGIHTFEPLKGFPVTRDLIVEHGHTYERFVASILENQTVEPIRTLKNFDHTFYWDVLDRLSMCRECMCCYSACPALQEESKWDEFIGPGAMMQIGLRYLDGRDQTDRIMQAVTSGLFQCNLCGECAVVCSSHIDIVGIMYGLQTAARERGLVPANAVPTEFRTPSDVALDYEGSNPEEILASGTCSIPTCHDSTTMNWFRERSAEQAQLRVDSHIRAEAAVTEEQAASLVEYFMRPS